VIASHPGVAAGVPELLTEPIALTAAEAAVVAEAVASATPPSVGFPAGVSETSRARGSRLAFFAGLREDEDEGGYPADAVGGYPADAGLREDEEDEEDEEPPPASAGYPPAAPLPAEHHPSPPPSPPNGCASIGELSAEGGYPAEGADVDGHSYFVAAAAARLRHALQEYMHDAFSRLRVRARVRVRVRVMVSPSAGLTE